MSDVCIGSPLKLSLEPRFQLERENPREKTAIVSLLMPRPLIRRGPGLLSESIAKYAPSQINAPEQTRGALEGFRVAP